MKYVIRNLHAMGIAGCATFAISGAAVAHPGHPLAEHGVAHWLFVPTHGGILLFVLAICAVAIVLQSARRRYQAVRSR